MAWSIVRVELNGWSSTDYTNLHDAMQKDGYSRLITGSDGKIYHMPPAEYAAFIADSITATTVRDNLLPVVAAVHSNYEIFVSKATDVAWYLSPSS